MMKFLFGNVMQKSVDTDADDLYTEKTMRLKARVSLIVVWVSASLICLLFTLFTFMPQPRYAYMGNGFLLNKLQNDLLSYAGLEGGLNTGTKLTPNDDDAFVFVNINKKFFLTRFPSGTEDSLVAVNNNTTKTTILTTREAGSVIRKIKTSNKKIPNTDFSIKPVPQ